MHNNHTSGSFDEPPRPFRCPACGLTHSSRWIAGGVTNKLLEIGEYARLCEGCCARARVSGKSRRRIERCVLRQCREGVPGAIERVVVLAPEVFGGA